MTDEKPPLRSIPGSGSGPKPWRRTGLDQSEQVTCDTCLADVGVLTSGVVPFVEAPRRLPTGKKTGGNSVWACVYCLARGKVTVLIRG